MRPVDFAKLVGIRIEMHELGPRSGDVEELVALRGNFAKPSTSEDDEVGVLDARNQFGIGTDPEIAAIMRVEGIKQRQAAVARGNR